MKTDLIGLMALLCVLQGCEVIPDADQTNIDQWSDNDESSSEQGQYSSALMEVEQDFKVPVPPGYHWEVTQSWGEHCTLCEAKYKDWGYCELSHMNGCCEHSWDFNLPGSGDRGKPVIASADGTVKKRGFNDGWGNYILLDHGGNICSRYAHMQDGGSNHLNVGDDVCQGLQLGSIGETGSAQGEHLHFQFEDCSTGISLPIAFSDGNGVPVCTRGEDVFDWDGQYDFLNLSNETKESCEQVPPPSEDEQLPEGGWVQGQCGNLSGCPLRPDCDRSTGHQFSDWYLLTERTTKEAAYLWSECSLDGKKDGDLSPLDFITKAEALKISMYLFGVMNDCQGNDDINWDSFDEEDWFLPVVACAVKYGIAENGGNDFDPNKRVSFSEAAKLASLPAVHAGVIQLKNPTEGHFPYIPQSHWSYSHVETIWAYGGIVTDPQHFRADQMVERREYIAMVAALSPCFCDNVKCDAGCSCEQDQFACVDPNSDPGLGGEDQPEEEPIEEEPDVEDPGEHVTVTCEVKDQWSECLNNKAALDVQCTLTNHGDEELKLSNLRMLPDDGFDHQHCEITDMELQTGVGLQLIDPGEEKFLYGHYGISCDQGFDQNEIDVYFDLYHKFQDERIWTYNVDSFDIPYKGFDHYCHVEPEPVCSPVGCAELGASCGMIEDGCGALVSCGSCQSGHTCIDLQCKPICSPGNCDSLGYECGYQDDGCGGMLSCGLCEYGKLCSDLGLCYDTCAPETCSSLARQCGQYDDGCGNELDCGGCASMSWCLDGQCHYFFDWNCWDAAYNITITAYGGSVQMLTKGGASYQHVYLPPTHPTTINIPCSDFPAAVRIHGGTLGISVVVPDGDPNFGAWLNYNGPMSFYPQSKPDVLGHSVSMSQPYSKIMLVMPPP